MFGQYLHFYPSTPSRYILFHQPPFKDGGNLLTISFGFIGNATLPPPSSDQTLQFLALGRGTQNYSCASTESNPVAVGALAVLYDASPLLATTPGDLLYTLPDYALELAAPFVPLTARGHHFFDSAGVPNFDLSSVGLYLIGATNASIPAAQPQTTFGLPIPETLPVNWLYLDAKNGGVGSTGLNGVYRVEVAGGEPPATCANITGTTFQVQYSALYVFYGPSNTTTTAPTSTMTTMTTVATPTATTTSTTCPVAGHACSTNGELACNGNSFGECVNGEWVLRECGSGLVCVPNGSSLYCGYPGSGPSTTCTSN